MADNGGKKSSTGNKTCHLPNIRNPKRVAERLKVSFQRVSASITNIRSGKNVDSEMVLIDVSEGGVGLFARKSLAIGSNVKVALQDPMPLEVKGIITWCVPTQSMMDTTKIRHTFRCGVRFIYASDVEKNAVLDYCQRVRDMMVNGVVSYTPMPTEVTATTATHESAPATEPSVADVAAAVAAVVPAMEQAADPDVAALAAEMMGQTSIMPSVTEAATPATTEEAPAASGESDEKKAA